MIDLKGQVLSSVQLIRGERNAILQYPLLSLSAAGTLHAGWTSQKRGVYLDSDIHHMASPDGGRTWKTLDGRPLPLPVIADDGGAAERVTLDDEFSSHTWLSSLEDGHVIGSFTDQRCSTTDARGKCRAYFFRIPVGSAAGNSKRSP